MSLTCKTCGVAIVLCWNGKSSGYCRSCYRAQYKKHWRKMQPKVLTPEQQEIEMQNMEWLRSLGMV